MTNCVCDLEERSMKRNDLVVFTWTLKSGVKQSLLTSGAYFKEYAIQLLEDQAVDKVFNVHYSHNNTTIELDYYNSSF